MYYFRVQSVLGSKHLSFASVNNKSALEVRLFHQEIKIKNIFSELNSPFSLLAALLHPCVCPVCVLAFLS